MEFREIGKYLDLGSWLVYDGLSHRFLVYFFHLSFPIDKLMKETKRSVLKCYSIIHGPIINNKVVFIYIFSIEMCNIFPL